MLTEFPVRRWLNIILPLFAIALITALLLPAIEQSREAARGSQSRNNLKQWGLAIQNYAETHEVLPLGANVDTGGVAHHGWPMRLIPYLAATPLYNQIDQNQPWDNPRNEPLMKQRHFAEFSPFLSGPFRTPEGYGLIHYAANPRVMHRNHCVTFDDMSDGTAHTWTLGEAAGDFLPWGYPFNWRPLGSTVNQSPTGYGIPGRPVTDFCLADGSVRSMSAEADSLLLQKWAVAPPVVTQQQVELLPRPASFRSTGATIEHVLITDGFRATVLSRPQLQLISVVVGGSSKDGHGDGPLPSASQLRTAIVDRYSNCTSLSLPNSLTPELIELLKELPRLAELEVESFSLPDGTAQSLQDLPSLRWLQVKSLGKETEQVLRRAMPDVQINASPSQSQGLD